MIRCLEDNLDEADFGSACRKEVERNQLRQGDGATPFSGFRLEGRYDRLKSA